MVDWDAYFRRININGSTQRDRLINKARQDILNKAIDSPAYKSVTINGVSDYLIIISGTTTTDKPTEKNFVTMPNHTITVGAMVVFNNTNWMVIQVDADNDITVRGKMTFCPHTLTFQNNSGTILSYPYYIDTDTASIQEGKIVTTSDSRKAIKLPFDVNTQMFHGGQRFLGTVFNKIPEVWKIYDLKEENGILTVYLEKDQYDEKTDKFGVADYFEPITPVQETNCEITYTGLPEIKIGGSAKTFTAKFYDVNGVELTDITATWNLIVPTGFEIFIISETTGNTINISVSDEVSIIGKTLLLQMSDGLELNTELNIRVVSLF
jgi:hypothetical protein